MLRDTLYHHIKPAVVMPYVNACTYFKKNPLNTHQMGVLANAKVRGDYSEFDITLLYSLLRNLIPSSCAIRPTAGWGKPVSAGDIALGDDVERIREIRNERHGHIASTSMTDATYNQYMQELSDICQRMDTLHSGSLSSPSPRPRTYSQTLLDIQVECIDPAMETLYIEKFKQMQTSDKETRDLTEKVRKDVEGSYILGLVFVLLVETSDILYQIDFILDCGIITGLNIITESDISPNIGFHGASATGMACQQGTLTPPDTWSRPFGTCICSSC